MVRRLPSCSSERGEPASGAPLRARASKHPRSRSAHENMTGMRGSGTGCHFVTTRDPRSCSAHENMTERRARRIGRLDDFGPRMNLRETMTEG